MTILFIHGWHSVPGGVKPTYLKEYGHEVINPSLDDDDFELAVRTAQAEFDKHQPPVVVGSSRGGAVAMNICIGDAKLVLLCPAWKNWGTATTVKPDTAILHSRADDVIPFGDSEELARNSSAKLIEVGSDHRLADPEPLTAMLRACENHSPKEQMELPCCGMTSVIRLKELPHVYGTDFDLFRCGRCWKAWVACWVAAATGGGWEPASDFDVSQMLRLAGQDLREFMKVWARDFD